MEGKERIHEIKLSAYVYTFLQILMVHVKKTVPLS